MVNKRITIIVNGRFHAFDYAMELQKRGNLAKLISSMPYSKAKKFGIEKKNYVGLPLFEVIKFFWRKFFRHEPPPVLYAKAFALTSRYFVPDNTDVIISLIGGYGLEVFKSKKLKHCVKIVDRVATHTLANLKLKRESMEYHRLKWVQYPPQKFIDRELEEYNIADKILVPSSFVKRTFLENGISENKLLQIPYTLSSKKFDIKPTENIKKKKTILFVGQVGARKGIGVLIDAMKLVRKDYKDYTLTVVGSINSNINPKILNIEWIDYKGVLSGQVLRNTYAQSAVFCLPSFEEGLAYVLTEANYMGLPIVATPNSGIEDIMKNNNEHFLVPVGNPNELGQKIKDAIMFNNRNQIDDVFNKDITTKQKMTWGIYCEKLISGI